MNSRAIFVRYVILLSLGLLGTGVHLSLRYGLPYPAPLVPKFTPGTKKEHLVAIEETKPQFVLIGDSVLDYGVDEALLGTELGASVHTIPLHGSGTAIWYLLMDNIILRAEHRPQFIVILFRNTMLTVPQYRTTGKYFELLDDYASGNEFLISDLAFINQMSPLEKFSKQYIPLYSERIKIRERLDSLIRYPPVSLMMGCDRSCADDAISSIFGREVDSIALNQLMEDAAQMLYSPRELDFEKQADESFLPYMIELAQQNGVKLVFIRTKTFGPEPAGLLEYNAALDTYLHSQGGVILLDYSADPRIIGDDYVDSLHMSMDGRRKFSLILAEEFRKILSR